MTVLRRWVWPGLKFSVFALIAIALVRLAFFAADPPMPQPTATGRLEDPTVTVEKRDIVNDVAAKGSIRSVPSTAVRATAAGTVNKVLVHDGAVVLQGAPLLEVKVETPAAPPTVSDPAAPPVATPAPKTTYATIVASADGRVSGLDLVTGQQVELGEVVARIAPDAYRAAATLDAAQLYRLTARPTEASVAIKDGPAPFTCPNLTLTSASGADGQGGDGGAPGSDGSGGGSDGSGSGDGSGTRLECDVPPGVTVFPGLEATISVAAGSAQGVLTLPVTAVTGSAEQGVVTTVSEGGERSQRKVTLGLSDGRRVEVRDGLAAGDTVLEFVPGVERKTDDGQHGGSGGGEERAG